MRNIIILCAFLSGIMTSLFAQPTEAVYIEKMKIFDAWVGHWQGVGSMQMGPGEPQKSTVDENIQSKLNGTILLVEGIGKAKNPQTQEENIVHHALAILEYDAINNQYKFRTHLKNGRSTDAWFKVVSENNYQWGFEAPNVKMRYTINLDPIQKTWHEIGEFSRDGNSWQKVFEMNLKKTE